MRRIAVLVFLIACSHAEAASVTAPVAAPIPIAPTDAGVVDPCVTPATTVVVTTPLAMPDFFAKLAERLDAHAASRSADFDAFAARHGIVAPTEALRRDFARTTLLFEATRDGGFWRMRWAITNHDATASGVWSGWRARAPDSSASASASATAECDELSALFASLARGVGVRNIGLFWPTWNHTIAAWDVAPGTRVLVPTSQIFLGCDDTFDRTSFDPKHQKVVYEFPASDLGKDVVPAALATFLFDRIDRYGDASSDVLAAIRIDRAIHLNSSVPASCARPLPKGKTCGDRRALETYASER